jgi:hypothetical protein
MGIHVTVYINSVRTSKETHYVSATKTNRLMPFRETVAVYFENHTKHTNIICGQNSQFYDAKTVGTHSNHWDLKR